MSSESVDKDKGTDHQKTRKAVQYPDRRCALSRWRFNSLACDRTDIDNCAVDMNHTMKLYKCLGF